VHDRGLDPTISPAREVLLRCLEDSAQPLLDSIRVFIYRFGVAHNGDPRSLAQEIFQEVAVEAIAHADRFSPERHPVPWLLGIALNIVRQRKAATARRAHQEIPSSTTDRRYQASYEASMEQTADILAAEQLARVEDDAEAEALLALVSADDQAVLRLAILEGWDRRGLARKLGTSDGAARVRLHRAIGRLRAAWYARELAQDKGASDE
jgi:RNA polymerase sigma-70 factor, ECF subfamily